MIQGRYVKMVIHADGTCSLDAINFTDASCTLATQQLIEALAGQTTNQREKPEARQLPNQGHQEREASR